MLQVVKNFLKKWKITKKKLGDIANKGPVALF